MVVTRGRRALSVLVVIGLVAVPGAAGKAYESLGPVSGPDPYGDLCGNGYPATPGTASGPSVAVDPTDPRHLLAVWHQNWPLAVRSAVSFDRGRSWKQVAVPDVQRCEGGSAEIAFFPHVAFGMDGRAYLSVTAGSNGVPPATSNLLVSRSLRGGRAWSEPVQVTSSSVTDGASPSIAVSPSDPRDLTAVWHREDPPTSNGSIWTASSEDRGRTWTVPALIHTPARPGMVPFGNALTALDDGTLLYPFVSFEAERYLPAALLGTASTNFVSPSRWEVEVLRSLDGGATWERAAVVGQTSSPLPQAIDSGDLVNIETIPSLAAAGKRVVIAWHSIDGESASAIQVARSNDRGQTFRPPQTIRDVPGQAFMPTVAYGPHRTLALTYYDLLDDLPGDQELTATPRLITSKGGGTGWRSRAFEASLDLHRAVPFVYGPARLRTYLPGHRQALVRTGNALFSAIGLAPPATGGNGARIVGGRVKVR